MVCANWQLFRATPTGIWLRDELAEVFGIDLKLNSRNADAIYDALEERLLRAEFRPRALFDRFNIEALATTDAATDTLEHHQAIRDSGWGGRVIPTFRPDAVVNIAGAGWRENMDLLSDVSGVDVSNFQDLHSGVGKQAGLLQIDGRHRHRPGRADRLHRIADRCRGRSDIPAGAEGRSER